VPSAIAACRIALILPLTLLAAAAFAKILTFLWLKMIFFDFAWN
jgi:hypothetical protein